MRTTLAEHQLWLISRYEISSHCGRETCTGLADLYNHMHEGLRSVDISCSGDV